HVVYKDGNPTETQAIILQGLFHPKYLGASASSGNILSFCGRKRYASLLAREPRHQRCTEKLTSAGCRLAIQPTPTEIGIRKAHQNQRRIRRIPKTKFRGEFQIPEDAFHHLPVGSARRSLVARTKADAELDVRSRRHQVQERADHAPVLLLVHRLAVQVLIKRRSRLRRQVAHVELPQQVSSVLNLMDKSALRSLLDL